MGKLLSKYKNMPVPAKASLWYTVCNILQKGISFIVIPLYTRILTVDEYGEYSVFQSWCNILVIFATLNLYAGVFTKAMVDYEDDRDRYTSSMQGLSTLITVILFAVYLVAFRFWNGLLEMGTVTMILMFGYFVFYPALTFWTVRQRVEYKYREMVAVTLLVSVLTPVLSLLLLFFTNLRAEAVIWGFLILQIAAGLFFYVYQFIRGKTFFIGKYWVHGLKFNIPLIPHYLSLIVLGQADRIMIKAYCGEAKTGIYNLAYQVSMIMNIFVNAINSSLVPWTYEKLKNRGYRDIKKVAGSLCVVVGVMTLGAVLVAPEIVRILGTEEYMEAVYVIPSVAISVYFTFCYGLFSNVEFYFSATKLVMVASVVGAVLNVILNAIFIPMYGFIAAGYTTLFCYFVFMVMHYLFMQRILRKKLQGEKVYDIRFIALSCLFMCLCGAGCMFLYRGIWARYAVILAALVLIVVFRKKIMSILSTIRK